MTTVVDPLTRPYLTRQEAAQYLGIAFMTLTNWASQKKGPPYFRPAGCRKTLYKVSDLEAFIESRKTTNA